MSVFIMLLAGALVVSKNASKLKCEHIKKEKYIEFFQGVKNEIMYNFTYEDLKNLKNKSKLYIQKDEMNWDFHEEKDIKMLFTDMVPKEKPYLEMKINEEEILKVDLILNYGKMKEDHLKCQFYKGRYKK